MLAKTDKREYKSSTLETKSVNADKNKSSNRVTKNKLKKPFDLSADARLQRYLKLKNKMSFISANDQSIKPNPLTRTFFLEAYSRGNWNLSIIPCPSFLQDVTMMAAPEYYNEKKRVKEMRAYQNKKQWWVYNEKINLLLLKALKHYKMQSATVSLISDRSQIIKYKFNLNMTECSKYIAIDAHTMLSKDYMIIQDTKKDWRTKKSPLVEGYPFIKTYAGVPLFSKSGYPIGVIAVFDQIKHTNITDKNISYLIDISTKIQEILESKVTSNSTRHNVSALDFHITNTKNIAEMIGRATSVNTKINLIFEKDGSGSSYLPNNNLRLNSHIFQKNSLQTCGSTILKEKLLGIKEIKDGANAYCEYIQQKYKFNFVAWIQINFAQAFTIEKKYCSEKEDEFNLETFKYTRALVPIEHDKLMTSIIGSFGIPKASSMQMKNRKVLQKAFSSEFGIHYSTDISRESIFKAGLLLPCSKSSPVFKKRNVFCSSEIDIAKNVSPIDDSPSLSEVNISSEKKAVLDLLSGGYLIGCFNYGTSDKIGDECIINDIFENACLIKKVFNIF